MEVGVCGVGGWEMGGYMEVKGRTVHGVGDVGVRYQEPYGGGGWKAVYIELDWKTD